MPAATKKVCQKCGKEKTLSEYFHNATKPDKHNGICKECQIIVNNQNK